MRSQEALSHLQPTCMCGLVIVLSVMHSMLFSRIYKNGTTQSAFGAVSPDFGWSISTFRADFVSFTSKFVRISPNLLGMSVFCQVITNVGIVSLGSLRKSSKYSMNLSIKSMSSTNKKTNEKSTANSPTSARRRDSFPYPATKPS